MKTKRTLLVGGLSGIMLLSPPVRAGDLQPMVVTSLTGTVNVQQDIPCGGHISQTTSVSGGAIRLTPADGLDVTGGKRFTLTRMTVFFAPFSASGSCGPFNDTRNYTEIGAQLAEAVVFTAAPGGGGVYNLTIPKESFVLFESVIDNGALETSYKHPSQDVTGTIDLSLGTVSLHAVLASTLHFKAGCFIVCAIDEDDDGTQTADIAGTIVFPDSDADGVPDRSDNCPLVPNPSQTPVATPVIAAPPSLTLPSCLDHHFGIAAATDVCRGRAVTVTSDAPSQFAIGANVVTWTGNDGADPLATAPQTVTIVDTTPPMITSIPPDIHLNDCQATPLGTPTATDDCAGPVTFTNDAPPKFYIGTTVVTWTASDVSGNHDTDTQNVTVVDTTPPVVSCTATNPPGNGFRAFATDSCDTPTIRLGGYVLANGEVVQIQETGQPGVRFVNTIGPDHVRHFQAGKGEAIITATDASNNSASAVCQ